MHCYCLHIQATKLLELQCTAVRSPQSTTGPHSANQWPRVSARVHLPQGQSCGILVGLRTHPCNQRQFSLALLGPPQNPTPACSASSLTLVCNDKKSKTLVVRRLYMISGHSRAFVCSVLFPAGLMKWMHLLARSMAKYHYSDTMCEFWPGTPPCTAASAFPPAAAVRVAAAACSYSYCMLTQGHKRPTETGNTGQVHWLLAISSLWTPTPYC